MIYVKPKGGLCNRIRVISSAIKLARAKNGACAGLCVVWMKEELNMETSFRALFVPSRDFELVDIGDPRQAEFSAKFSGSNARYIGQDKMGSWDDRLASVERILASDEGDWYIETFNAFQKDLGFEWLKPTPAIQEEVDRYYATMGPNCIGMHIRRTDNFMCILYSPTSYFEYVARKEIADNENTRIYLASDDDETKQQFVKAFGNHILTRRGLAGRFAKGGTEEGLVDLLLLSRTRKIFGCFFSSYGEYAALIGRVPYKQLKDPSADNVIWRAVLLLKQQYNRTEVVKDALAHAQSSITRASQLLGVPPVEDASSRVVSQDMSLYATPPGKAWDKWTVFSDWELHPDLICSLGGDCIAASQVKERGLRPFSLPFDWCMSDGEVAMKNLANQFAVGFADFARFQNMKSIPDIRYGYKDVKTGFSFIHHFKATIETEGEFDRFDEILQRRLRRLEKAISSSREVLFLLSRTWELNSSCLNSIYESCSKRWPGKKFRFVMVTYNSKASRPFHDDTFGVVRIPRDRNSYDLHGRAFEWSFLDTIHYSEDAKRMHDMLAHEGKV